jgi:hypothetical protein
LEKFGLGPQSGLNVNHPSDTLQFLPIHSDYEDCGT